MNSKYHVGRYLAGQNVEVVLKGGLVEIFSDAVLVATHARKHPPELDDSVHRQALAALASRPSTDAVAIRKVDKNGAVRFAGTPYWVGPPSPDCSSPGGLPRCASGSCATA